MLAGVFLRKIIRVTAIVVFLAAQFWLYKIQFDDAPKNRLEEIASPLGGYTEILGIRNVSSIVCFALFQCNILITVAITALIRKSVHPILPVVFLLEIGALLYVTTNLLAKLINHSALSYISIEIADFFCSPLPTFFLIPALELARFKSFESGK